VEFGTLSFVVLVGSTISTVLTVVVAFIAPVFSHGVKLAEFRQAWINEQRKDVADYMGLAREWVELWDRRNVLGGGTKEEKGELFTLANKALVIFWRIKMRVNPFPNEFAAQDTEFLRLLGKLLEPPPPDPNGVGPAESMWRKEAEKALIQAQKIFKTEWEVTKKTLLQSFWERWRSQRKATVEKIECQQGYIDSKRWTG